MSTIDVESGSTEIASARNNCFSCSYMNVDCSTVGTVAESFKRAIEPGNGASAAKLLPIVRGATFVSGVAATRW